MWWWHSVLRNIFEFYIGENFFGTEKKTIQVQNILNKEDYFALLELFWKLGCVATNICIRRAFNAILR